MTREEAFDVWALQAAVWSPWVKPVLFAYMSERLIGAEEEALPVTFELDWAPDPGAKAALVIDLPGSNGVAAGLALAVRGYRPVPLYNAAPGPTGAPLPDGTPRDLRTSVVDALTIVRALETATPALARIALPDEAPPAFLLDANRRGDAAAPPPGRFDNRSVSFVTDFPSANLLRSRSIHRAVLCQTTGDQPQPDLAHTLALWQSAGIAIEVKALDRPGGPSACTVRRPGGLSALWARFLATLRLRRSPFGGFGGMVPQPSSG